MEPVLHDVTTPDGRRLAVRTAGAPAPRALLLLTGTPSGGLVFEPFAAAAQARGLRFVTYSRPGYGDSTRRNGRTVAYCAEDVATPRPRSEDIVARVPGARLIEIPNGAHLVALEQPAAVLEAIASAIASPIARSAPAT